METKEDYILSASDRCDRCSAEALVLVKGVTGELMFCGHHYNKIVEDTLAHQNLINFSYEIIDEREKIKEQ
jgi:hypothetical protein